jgi:hypothetical protein
LDFDPVGLRHIKPFQLNGLVAQMHEDVSLSFRTIHPLSYHGSNILPLGSLGGYLAHWRVNAPVYSALEWVFPTKGLVGVPVAVGFAVALWARRRLALESPEAWAWPVATTLLFAPAIFPWYLVWVTPFLFTSRTLPLAVWTVSSVLVYWPLPEWAAMVVEYGSVLGVAGLMLAQSVGERRATSHLTGQ